MSNRNEINYTGVPRSNSPAGVFSLSFEESNDGHVFDPFLSISRLVCLRSIYEKRERKNKDDHDNIAFLVVVDITDVYLTSCQ